ncbi:hypothetical protein PBI_HILLTOPFARM_88 [Mycobacterium phage Hilltopfarm]|nr:hypothetical protein PBI_HILLTOPFARM_88 [Mycobacterium phage Hilltopfarm]
MARPLTPREQWQRDRDRYLARKARNEFLLLPGSALVIDTPPVAVLTDGVVDKPLQTLDTRLTSRGEAVLNRLLRSWTDSSNRPVVEHWMALQLQGMVAAPDDLPHNLRPDEGGAYWLCGNEVYLWTGGRYAIVTLPPPEPQHVITTDRPLTGDQVEQVRDAWNGTQLQTWGGELVAAPQRPAPPPAPVRHARYYQQQDLTAIGPCPRCGAIDVHWLRPPELPHPEPEPEVIRTCRDCGQEWGEK